MLCNVIMQNNWPLNENTCIMGTEFLETIVEDSDGFAWVNEAPASDTPKYGMIATKPGSWLVMKVNSAVVRLSACYMTFWSMEVMHDHARPAYSCDAGNRRV